MFVYIWFIFVLLVAISIDDLSHFLQPAFLANEFSSSVSSSNTTPAPVITRT